MKPWIVLPTVFMLTAAGCGGSSSSPSAGPSGPPLSASITPPSPAASADVLTGTWQTAALPTATFVATYRKAGGTARQAQQFVGRLTTNPSAGHRVVLRIGDGQWVQFAQDDSATPQVGWTGTYRLQGSRVVAHETSTGCEVVYRFQVVGAVLGFRVVSAGPPHNSQCGSVELALPSHALYETAAFHRVS